MKLFFLLLCFFLFFSCSQNQQQSNSANENALSDSVSAIVSFEIPVIDATALEEKITDTLNNEVYYITIADTGTDYFLLHKAMNEISSQCKLGIDTLGKEFNAKKQKIAMPENSEDEMYRGEYYPRRYTSNTLSLEYLNFYYNKSSNNNMAVVVSICSEKDSALYYAKKITQGTGHVFVVRSNVYVGCMH